MDDWNDFGPPGPRDAPLPPPQGTLPRPEYERSDSTPSTLESVSDSSVALLGSSNSSSSASSYTPPPTDSISDPSATDPTRENDHSSFLSSLPFIGSAAARSRRADRQAAVAAAAALADGRIGSSGNVVVPLGRSELADRRTGSGNDSDHVSAASESDSGGEPASVMMPRTTAKVQVDSEEEGEYSGERLVRRGALDDVPDDFELNIEGFRYTTLNAPGSMQSDLDEGHSSVVASSMLKHVEKSYTKLEVISARQIRNLLLFFNIFVVMSLIWTIVVIVYSNTKFVTTQALPIPQQLLSPQQIDSAVSTGVVILQPRPRASSKARSMGSLQDEVVPVEVRIAGAKYLASQGLYWTRSGVKRGPVVSLDASGTVRQQVPMYSLAKVPSDYGRTEGTSVVPSLLRQEEDVKPTHLKVALLPIKISIATVAFKMTSHLTTLFLSVFFFILGVLFSIRLTRQGKKQTCHEQIWVLVLIFVTSLYFNPLESALRMIEELDENTSVNKFNRWVYDMDNALIILRDVAFTGFSFFYLWVSLHSYRILDPVKRLDFKHFYLPKIVVLLPYVVFKSVAYGSMRIWLSEIPMMSGPALAFTFGSYRIWSYLRAELLYCVAASVIEALLVGVIIYETVKTMQILERAPYMKHRTKRVGFRFFLYINGMFYPIFFLLQWLLLFARPKGENILQVIVGIDSPKADVLWYNTVGPCVLVMGYVLVTAHVHLPYTSVGVFKGWFRSSELADPGSRWSFSSAESNSTRQALSTGKSDPKYKAGTWSNDEHTPRSVVDNDDELEQQIVEPITYRMKESPNMLELKANCFTMQTHVIMFNFAWYVYYYGTPKLSSWKTKKNPLPFEYKIAAQIKSLATDTQALVVDGYDRIIVTFKGTTSMRNLRTSLHMNHERLQSVIRTSVYGEDETARLKRLFGRKYSNGKIHKGFAIAYRSVADEVMENVRILRAKKQRPVFLTGHSLGGALATICSLDLWVKLEISRREIFVSTFGSPRVGNTDFAMVYKEVVPLHWRIVVDPDMVAKLPKVGYRHVGKKAVLTPHGDMFLDPGALETRPWSGEAAGFAYHRKASYLLAMRAWCVRNHGMTYTPSFWPFPVRREDHKRFAGAFSDSDEPKGHSQKVASKIIQMDAMVDALGHGDAGLANMAVVEKWARLTRRILLNAKLVESTSSE